jgi:hypothetical protein
MDMTAGYEPGSRLCSDVEAAAVDLEVQPGPDDDAVES